jgi:hypothetical protein
MSCSILIELSFAALLLSGRTSSEDTRAPQVQAPGRSAGGGRAGGADARAGV